MNAALRPVLHLEMVRIVRALAARTRYRYVQPRVASEGDAWVVWSPNCSRQVDPGGGEIPIARLAPMAAEATPDGRRWALYARHHGRRQWVLQADGLGLDEAAAHVAADPAGLYWP